MYRRIIVTYREAFSGLPRDIWLLSLANLVNRSGTMVLPFLSLYFTQSLDFSTAQAGQLVGLYGAGSICGAYLGGWLTDRLDAVRVQQLSLAATGVGFLILAQFERFASVAVALFFASVVAEAFRPALMVATAAATPPALRARSFALVRLATNLGMALGPALGGWLATRSYGLLFLADAVTCWAAAALLLVTLGRGRPILTGDPAGAQEAHRSPWRDGPFVAFFVLTMLFAVVFFQIWTTFPIFLRTSYQFSEALIGGLMAFNALVVVLFEMVLLKRIERCEPLRVVALGALLVGVGLGLLPLGSGVAVAVLSISVWTAGEMLALPVSNAVVAGRAAAGSTGRYMGMYNMAFGIAFVISPILGTAVYELVGSAVLWFSAAIAGVLLCLAYRALARPMRQPRGASGGQGHLPTGGELPPV